MDDVELYHYLKGQNGFNQDHEGWPFDHPYYFIMNLAIGGMLGKDPDPTAYPQEFIIKSVEVTKL